MIYDVTPMGKPRLPNKLKFSALGKRYWAYKEELRWKGAHVPESGATVTFVIPMPKSWSKKKRAQMDGQAHQQTPDIDNLVKGLLDAVYDDDKTVWDIRAVKVWGVTGQIQITQSGVENDSRSGRNTVAHSQ